MSDAVFPSAVIATLTLLMEPAQVVELRVLDVSTPDYRRPHTVSGYFDDMTKLADAALKLRQAKGLYVTLNPVNPALLARAANRVRDVREEESTPDTYVLRRRWLPIDCDPVRPSGIAATGDEHQAGLSRAREISATLRAVGWPDPIDGDGGNSGHLLYLIDLPNDDECRALLQRCLDALAFRFNDRPVVIDQTVHNAARIWRLYGTMNRIGDDIPERPHRLARLLRVPDNLIPVSRALLEALVRSLPEQKEPKQSVWQGRERPFDLDRWISQHGLDVVGPHPWKQGRKWIFSVCPWNPDHRNRSAFILQFPSGGIDASCHHNGCVGKDWPALRDMVEPGWRERRARNTQRNVQPASGTFGSAIVEVRETTGGRPSIKYVINPRVKEISQ